MEKKAILIKGVPTILDNIEEFKQNSRKNVEIMSKIALSEGYNVQFAYLDNMIKVINKSVKSDEFLFYYTGHATKDNLGTLEYKTNDVLKAMNGISGKKLIILDACAGGYPGGQNFEALNLPNNSVIISAKEVYDNKSLAKLLYDAVIFRKIPLNNVNKATFDEMKHNWVYFKRNR